MEQMGEQNNVVDAFEQKRIHRSEKAKLSFEEKVLRVISLQKLARPMLQRLGKRSVIWA